MNVVKITLANLRDKPLSTFLSTLLMALGVGLISLLVLISQQLEDKFTRNLKGIDMVVGAKGSPLQIILSSIYQIDSPTGNIPLDDANRLSRNPMVKTAIPLSMGDNYKLFRIVGTDQRYLDHFEAKLAQGRVFQQPLEAVLGDKVARQTGLKIGDTFAGAHGFDAEGHVHGDAKYKVVGIAAFNNSVVDNVILTPYESIWKVHEGQEGSQGNEIIGEMVNGEATPDSAAGPAHEITSLLISFRNPMGNVILPRIINENSKLQAASPALEINRMLDLLGVGVDTLRWMALVIIVIAGVSVFISLYNSLKERKYEMALMLSMGATRGRLFLMLLLEGLIISVFGYLFGLLFSRIALGILSAGADQSFHYSFQVMALTTPEVYLFGGVLALGLLAAALPSLTIYRINLSRTLAEE
ncbi:MAG: ABC transporter permease [Siphonobacter aquaeclarae]|nr:ABC transporter permease [Siphonobacter aquaeclarae]